MRNIDKYLEIAEGADWNVSTEEFEDGRGIDIDFGWETTRGQDFHMNIYINQDDPEELMEEIYKYWDGFDPEEEAMIWIDPSTGKGGNGAPESIIDIIKDMQEAKDCILELYKLMNGKVWNVRDVKVFKESYNYALEELIEAKHDAKSPNAASLIRNYELADNCYGDCYICLGRKKIEIESIYYKGDDALVHVSCEAFEADVKMVNLSVDNIKRVMRFLHKVYRNNLKEDNYRYKAN